MGGKHERVENFILFFEILKKLFSANRVIRKVRKTKHRNPEFGHEQGEIQKNPEKEVH
jgi:hypothetical protein